jgi:uncharacterized protein YeaO (DUF488 family)
MIRIKRAYEPPSRGDGLRFLVERLWPRGMKKSQLHAEAWLKDIAPSTALRTWYGHRIERWPEFRKRYRSELRQNEPALAPLLAAARRRNVTLLYAARDEAHNSAVVLREHLEQRLANTPAR